MERTIEVRARVGNHLDLANLELRARSVMPLRFFAAEKVTDDRRRQTFVSDQAMLDRVAEIDEPCGDSHIQQLQRNIPMLLRRVGVALILEQRESADEFG